MRSTPDAVFDSLRGVWVGDAVVREGEHGGGWLRWTWVEARDSLGGQTSALGYFRCLNTFR